MTRTALLLVALLATCDSEHVVHPSQPQVTGGVCLGPQRGSAP